MSDFLPEPSLLLLTKDDLLSAISNPVWMTWDFPRSWHVKSQWLCDELNKYERDIAFPYNSVVQRYLEKREGWPEADRYLGESVLHF